MHLCNTKNNHYVPRFYLKNFISKNGNIYGFDKKEKRISYIKKTRNIAFKKDLYTIKSKINKADEFYFCKIFKISIDTENKKFYLKALISFLNDDFTELFKKNYEDKSIEKQINKSLSEMLTEKELSRNQELLFSLYENDFERVLQNILNKEEILSLQKTQDDILVYLYNKTLLFIFDKMYQKILTVASKFDKTAYKKIKPLKSISMCGKNQYFDLLHYILIQYFRTNKIISSKEVETGIKSIKYKVEESLPNPQNIIFLLIHYQILNISAKLIQDKYQVILLKNYTEELFFTSDNPSVNTQAELFKQYGPEKCGYEIFFPLSPKLALLVTNTASIDKDYDKQKQEIIIKKEEKIKYYNKLIFNQADRFIYVSQLDSINKFLQYNNNFY